MFSSEFAEINLKTITKIQIQETTQWKLQSTGPNTTDEKQKISLDFQNLNRIKGQNWIKSNYWTPDKLLCVAFPEICLFAFCLLRFFPRFQKGNFRISLRLDSISAALSCPIPGGSPREDRKRVRGKECGLFSRTAAGNRVLLVTCRSVCLYYTQANGQESYCPSSQTDDPSLALNRVIKESLEFWMCCCCVVFSNTSKSRQTDHEMITIFPCVDAIHARSALFTQRVNK